jgi:GT2 family glycosyltransferase
MSARTSIVILSHNGLDYTRTCLQSIREASSLPKEVLVVDNGSTDGTSEWLATQGEVFTDAGIGFTPLRNEENVGCSAARNGAWEHATGEFVVFLDNDTAVCTPDWLTRLEAEMDADDKLAVLGAKMIYPYKPHPIQCAGVDINPQGRIRFRGRGADRHDPEYCRRIKVPALISACWIKRNRFLQELGGLDELFHPVQYEDLDFCLRANEAGYYCAYTPDVEIYHFEGMTTASFGQGEYVRNIVANSAKFRNKWRDVIATYPPDDADYAWADRNQFGMTPELDLTMI